MSQPESQMPSSALSTKRRYVWLISIVAFAIIVVGGYMFWMAHRHSVSTHDAYVAGNIVHISPQISGTVTAIHADNTQFVSAGELLVNLDKMDAELSLKQAEADFFQVQRETERLYASTQQLQAMADVREAELKQAKDNLRRRQQLRALGHISHEELESAETAVKVSNDKLLAANRQLKGHQALTDGLTPTTHPTVMKAEIAIRNSYLSFARTNIISPISGYVEKRAVQVGQRVDPGQSLMVVIPLDQLWVDANFKEVELKNIRIGQPAILYADIYGKRVKYVGRVIGIGGGTGSVFSLLPPQNATGNWIKIVQRVPVRISLDPEQLAKFPLRLGLSMEVKVDTRDQSGPILNTQERDKPVIQTFVYEAIKHELENHLYRLEHSTLCANC